MNLSKHRCPYPCLEPGVGWAWRCAYCHILWWGCRNKSYWVKAPSIINFWARIVGF